MEGLFLLLSVIRFPTLCSRGLLVFSVTSLYQPSPFSIFNFPLTWTPHQHSNVSHLKPSLAPLDWPCIIIPYLLLVTDRSVYTPPAHSTP